MTQIVIGNVGYFTSYYNRLVIEERKEPKVAITATANKLTRVMLHMIHTNEKFNPPTVKNQELSKSKIQRLTSENLKKLKKEKRLDPLTQNTNNVYLTRV